jgi:hypothetical protein
MKQKPEQGNPTIARANEGRTTMIGLQKKIVVIIGAMALAASPPERKSEAKSKGR